MNVSLYTQNYRGFTENRQGGDIDGNGKDRGSRKAGQSARCRLLSEPLPYAAHHQGIPAWHDFSRRRYDGRPIARQAHLCQEEPPSHGASLQRTAGHRLRGLPQGILHGRTAACRHDHCHRRIHCRRTAVQPARAEALPDASRGHSPDLDLMQRPDTPAPARHPPSRHQAIEHHGAARRELERPLPAHRLRCRADRQRRTRRRHAAARHKRLCAAGAVWQRPDRCAQ